MTTFVLLFALFFFVLFVGGISVSVFLYTNGAFKEKMRLGKRARLKAASFAQTGTISSASAIASLYPESTPTKKKRHMSTRTQLVICGLFFIVTLVALFVLVMGATQF